jgi:SagB-type dehydrogenase family enzyme
MNKEISDLDKRIAESTELVFASDSPEVPEEWLRIFYKTYPRFEQIKLSVDDIPNISLKESVLQRKSDREYAGPINFKELSTLIYYSCGIISVDKDARRMYPSAGARYPIECYVISKSVEGILPGLYHYDVKHNTFETLFVDNMKKDIDDILINQKFLSDSLSALVILTSVLSRTEVKYGVNSYNFSLLEAGHIAQNMYLISHSLDIGICAIGMLNRSNVVNLLDITEEEIPLYGLSLGKISKTA